MHFKAPGREGFLQDLAGCKAVMATVGDTLITEALHLHKPYPALPMRGQFEQEIDAFFLEQRGCGRNPKQVTPEGIGDFLYRLPAYETRLTEYPGSDKTALLGMLDGLLGNDADLARTASSTARGIDDPLIKAVYARRCLPARGQAALRVV